MSELQFKFIASNIFQARENKFIVRDFVYNPEELQAGKNELTKLATDKKKQFGPLVIMINYNSLVLCSTLSILGSVVESQL